MRSDEIKRGVERAPNRSLLFALGLTEEEAEVFRRGRNVKVHSVPKHASLGDYHAATGMEALFGYLYLLGRRERISALFARIVEDD